MGEMGASFAGVVVEVGELPAALRDFRIMRVVCAFVDSADLGDPDEHTTLRRLSSHLSALAFIVHHWVSMSQSSID